MNIFKKVQKDTYFMDKGDGVIFTSEGNKQNVLNIIKALDPQEFEQYGSKNGNFFIPIFEDLVKLDSDNFVLPDYSKYTFKYYGKFELDLEKFYEACEREKIPCIFLSISGIGLYKHSEGECG